MKHGTIAEAARFAGVKPQYAGRVAHNQQDWRKARPSLVRALLCDSTWVPTGGRKAAMRWLEAERLKLAPPLDK